MLNAAFGRPATVGLMRIALTGIDGREGCEVRLLSALMACATPLTPR